MRRWRDFSLIFKAKAKAEAKVMGIEHRAYCSIGQIEHSLIKRIVSLSSPIGAICL